MKSELITRLPNVPIVQHQDVIWDQNMVAEMEVDINGITGDVRDLVVGIVVVDPVADHAVEVTVVDDHHPHIDDDPHPRTQVVGHGHARLVWRTPMVPIS